MCADDRHARECRIAREVLREQWTKKINGTSDAPLATLSWLTFLPWLFRWIKQSRLIRELLFREVRRTSKDYHERAKTDRQMRNWRSILSLRRWWMLRVWLEISTRRSEVMIGRRVRRFYFECGRSSVTGQRTDQIIGIDRTSSTGSEETSRDLWTRNECWSLFPSHFDLCLNG